jgi:hypothetical protein
MKEKDNQIPLHPLSEEALFQERIRRRKKYPFYLKEAHEEPTKGLHNHRCRLCREEEVCSNDTCYWTYIYICLKCAENFDDYFGGVEGF